MPRYGAHQRNLQTRREMHLTGRPAVTYSRAMDETLRVRQINREKLLKHSCSARQIPLNHKL